MGKGKIYEELNKATNERNVGQLNANATNISGLVEILRNKLGELDREIKADKEGLKEFEAELTLLNLRKDDMEKRIDANRKWIAEFEGDSGFEAQYKKLIADIGQVYSGAKEFHAKGIQMLIREFQYHPAYKRWNDTFTAIPFKPK